LQACGWGPCYRCGTIVRAVSVKKSARRGHAVAVNMLSPNRRKLADSPPRGDNESAHILLAPGGQAGQVPIQRMPGSIEYCSALEGGGNHVRSEKGQLAGGIIG
jgi:hypothetical protein